MEMRYIGQFHEMEVFDVPPGEIGAKDLDKITEAFHKRHKDLFTFNMPGREVEFLNVRLKATARQERLKLAEIPRATGDAAEALKRRRPVLWDLAKGYEETPIYDGTKLACGHKIPGPAVIEEPATTVVIPGSYVCAVDGVKNYILSRR
jgi:N-methylhydantoinase A